MGEVGLLVHESVQPVASEILMTHPINHIPPSHPAEHGKGRFGF
jgi:hypothetical protein